MDALLSSLAFALIAVTCGVIVYWNLGGEEW